MTDNRIDWLCVVVWVPLLILGTALVCVLAAGAALVASAVLEFAQHALVAAWTWTAAHRGELAVAVGAVFAAILAIGWGEL